MDAATLRNQAAQLEVLTEDLTAAAEVTPDVLVNPTLEKIQECKEVLYEAVDVALRAASRGSRGVDDEARLSAEAEAELSAKETKIDALIRGVQKQLEEQPWHNPPQLRAMRQGVAALGKNISELRTLQDKLMGRRLLQSSSWGCATTAERPAEPPLQLLSAPAATEEVKRILVEDEGIMPIDKALSLLMNRKRDPYNGGLVGIVHAAGVQEMTAFTAHSPSKFEFVFAAKSSAAFNLHQFSAMI